VLAEVAKLPRGTWRNSLTLDGYDHPLTIEAALTVSDQGIHVDYTGTSAPVPRGINVPLVYTTAYTVFGLGCVVGHSIPNNAGSLAPLTVSAPADCILNAQKPAAVTARHVLGQMLPDVAFGCLRQVIPDRVPAEGTACLWSISVRGRRRGGDGANHGYSGILSTNGGTGARPRQDGLSATAYPSGVQGTPVEIAETQAPLIFWRKELRPDSGGAGRNRGGLGQIIELSSSEDAPFELVASFDRIDHPPRGRDGGLNGAAGYVGLASGQRLRGKGRQEIPPKERLVVLTPGGGGLGDPATRDPAKLAADLTNGLVSPAAARNVYSQAPAAPMKD
jgi:N-methylhydantoinase B